MLRIALVFLFAFVSAADAADCARPTDLRFEVTGKIILRDYIKAPVTRG